VTQCFFVYMAHFVLTIGFLCTALSVIIFVFFGCNVPASFCGKCKHITCINQWRSKGVMGWTISNGICRGATATAFVRSMKKIVLEFNN